MCNKTLRQARLKDSFIQVLKIDKGHKVLDFPTADTVLTEGDRMVVYGRIDSILKIIMNKSKKSKTEKRV
jgi:Trk K+ transport system NAD-binding subunit